MSWKDDPFRVPLWSERPRCRCGFRAWMVTIMDRSDRNYGRRCFKCPDLDNNFMQCTFLEWIDTVHLLGQGGYLRRQKQKVDTWSGWMRPVKLSVKQYLNVNVN
ncbi:hypothetical protein BS78_07G014800 [Paspalum vaginatum]|nr:hypothetical protein BS78_07G014800 [Paspalum vaginatum]